MVASAYAVVSGFETVGLWRERRWAEYLTALSTAGFLPLELYELSERVTFVRIATMVVNLTILAYLVVAKHLFGIGGPLPAPVSPPVEELPISRRPPAYRERRVDGPRAAGEHGRPLTLTSCPLMPDRQGTSAGAVGSVWAVVLALVAVAVAHVVAFDRSRPFLLADSYTLWIYLPAYGIAVTAACFGSRTLAIVAGLLVVAQLAWVLPPVFRTDSIPAAARTAPRYES